MFSFTRLFTVRAPPGYPKTREILYAFVKFAGGIDLKKKRLKKNWGPGGVGLIGFGKGAT